MKTRSFLSFVAPSVVLMLGLMAVPLLLTFHLSTRHCAPEMEMVTVRQSGPFGTQETVTQQVRKGPDGKPLQSCRFAGLEYYRKVLGLDRGEDLQRAGAGAESSAGGATPGSEGGAGKPAAVSNEFWSALRFTLLYIALTTPLVLGLGFALALGASALTQRLKAVFITASLLPFIITPVVGALSIKWLFRDDGLVAVLLAQFGVQVHWMAQAWSAQLLVILYGVWHVVPFAFIVLYAGLQSVPQDALEAATIDGASRWQKLRYVTVPHLMPLIVFVTLIHVMDAYRVFEPVLVLTQGAFTTSVQYLTYHVLLVENNPYKASAAAVLTVLGIGLLLVPLLRRTWREQRGQV
jgi:multiple sugar transport system permease protein